MHVRYFIFLLLALLCSCSTQRSTQQKVDASSVSIDTSHLEEKSDKTTFRWDFLLALCDSLGMHMRADSLRSDADGGLTVYNPDIIVSVAKPEVTTGSAEVEISADSLVRTNDHIEQSSMTADCDETTKEVKAASPVSLTWLFVPVAIIICGCILRWYHKRKS